MDGPKTPQHLAPVLDFLNRNLRSEQSWSIADEFPTVFNDRNLHNIHIIENDNRVLSHAAVHPMIVKSPYAIFKVGAIGSVVTDPACRRQGLSQKIIQTCLDHAKKQDCDFAILWTNLYDFYRKMGFELAGSEVSILWQKDHGIEKPSTRRFSNQKNIAASTLLSAYSKHTVTAVRTLNDVQKYLNIPNTEVFTSWSPEQKLTAYAVIGKGADLKNYVHEWGGATPDLLALFNWIYTQREQPLTIIAPEHAKNLISSCESHSVPVHRGHLGMIRILNSQSFFKKVTRRARTLGIADFAIEPQGQGFELTCHREKILVEKESDLVRLFFGPEKASKLLPGFKSAQYLDKVFPIEMWIWGWDSV